MKCRLSTVVGVCIATGFVVACLLGNGVSGNRAFAGQKESGSQAKRSGAMKYHEILQKRPQPGYLFDRFYNTWLDESTTEELQQFLESQAEKSKTTADRLLVAFFHAKQGDDVAAIEEFRRALATDPGSAAIWYNKALIEARTLDFETAIADLKKAKEKKPDAKLAVLIDKQLGKLLLRNRQTDEAIKVWKSLLAAHPADEELCEDIIELHIDEGLFKEAAEMATGLITRTKDPYLAITRRLRLGDIYHRSDKRDKAIAVYSSALDKVGHGSWLEREILSQIERIFRREDDLTGLKKEYDSLLKTHPKRIDIHRRLAKLQVELGKNDDAIKIYRNILKLTPGERSLREQYVATLAKIGRHDEAIKELKSLCAQHPKDAELQVHLAKVMHEAKRVPDAVDAVREYLKTGDQTEYTYLRAARLLEQFGDTSAAADVYKQMIEKYSDSSSALEAQASFLYENKKKDEALSIWSKLAKDADVNQTLHVARALTARREQETALKLLRAREKDFADEPLFFGQLVTIAMQLKKFEAALPWARRRVELSKTTSELETALTAAASACERSDKLDEVIKSLSDAERSVQSTCLLAELLERRGDSTHADKVLAEAAGNNELLAIGEQIRLFSQRAEWVAAAKAVRRIMELPGGHKSQHVRKLAELYERDFKIDEALKWIEEWKRISPGNTAPWFSEARLLKLQGKETEALDALRVAIGRFDGNADLRVQLAQMYTEAGKTADAERIYWQLYEETDDIVSKLRWAQQLGSLAQQQGKVERLVENFTERCRNNRRSIVPLLSLAEIHRTTDNYEGRRQALTDAAKIKPDDLHLLLHIASVEEKEGDWRASLATLERALPLDKTSKTRERMAHLHLEYGSADEGYAILFELAGGEKADPRIIETIADTMCGMQEWERAADFLAQRISDHPEDYRLRYLLAVAQEEAGRTEQAVAEFALLLDGQQELKKNATKKKTTNSLGSYIGMIKDLLPPAAVEWFELTQYQYTVYRYRQRQDIRYSTVSSGSSSIRSTIQMPYSVEQVRPYALIHLIKLADEMEEEKVTELTALMRSHGIRDAEMITSMGVSRGGDIGKIAETLEKHPDSETALAIFVISGFSRQQGGSAEYAIRAFKKFRESRPQLAIMAGLQAAGDEEQGKKVIDDVFALAATIKKPNPLMVMSLAQSLGGMPGSRRQVTVAEEHHKKLAELLIGWYPQMQGSSPWGPWMFNYVVMALRAGSDPVLYFTFLDDEVARWRGGGKNGFSNRNAAVISRQSNQQLIAPFAFPPKMLSDFPANVLAIFQKDRNNPYTSMMAAQGKTEETWDKEKVKALLKKTKDPILRLLLAHHHEDEKQVKQTLTELLAAKPPKLDVYLLAAGKASADSRHADTVALLEKARYLPMQQEMRQQVDSGLVAAVIAAKGEFETKGDKPDGKSTDKMIEAGRSAALRLRRARLPAQQRNELILAMQDLGLKKEADKLDKIASKAAARSGVSTLAAPYISSGGRVSKDRISRLVAEGKRDAALRLLVNEVQSHVRQLFASPGNSQYMRHQFRSLKQRVEKLGMMEDLLKKIAATDKNSSLRMREYAVVCDYFGRKDEARKIYEKVLAKRGKDEIVRARLVLLLVEKAASEKKTSDFEKIPGLDEHLKKLTGTAASQMFGQALQEMVQDHETSFDERINVAQLATCYLRLAKDDKTAQTHWAKNFVQTLAGQMYSNNAGFGLPSLYDVKDSNSNISSYGRNSTSQKAKECQKQRQQTHHEFCLCMMEIPELGRDGFRHLLASAEASRQTVFPAKESEDVKNLNALFEDDEQSNTKPADEFATLARRVLLAEADDKNRHRQSMYGGSVHYYNSSNAQVRFRDPEEYLVRLAWLSDDWKPVDEGLLPKLEGRLGKPIKDRLTNLSKLYKCPEGEFMATAAEVAKLNSPAIHPGMPVTNEGQAMVVEAWADRKLSLDIQAMLIKWLQRDIKTNTQYIMPNQHEFITRYLSILAERGKREKVMGMLEEVATVLVAPRGKRADFIKKNYDPHRRTYGTDNDRIHVYRQLLQSLSQREGLLFAIVEHADQYDEFKAVDNLDYRVSNIIQRSQSKDAASIMATLEKTPWLKDLREFRVLRLGNMANQWPLMKALDIIRRNPKHRKAIRETIAKREKTKPTFGGSLLLAYLAEEGDHAPVLEHLGKNLAAIKKLPETRQGYLSTMYHELLPSSTVTKAVASKDTAKSKQAREVQEWLKSSQAGKSEQLLAKIRKAKRIEDLGVDHPWNLGQLLSAKMSELAKSDPDITGEIFAKIAKLAEDSAKQGNWPYDSGEDRTVKGQLLEQAFGHSGGNSPERLSVLLDILSKNEIETAYATRYFVDHSLEKMLEGMDGKKRFNYEHRIKRFYSELGPKFEGRPIVLFSVSLYQKLNQNISAEQAGQMAQWAKKEMSAGKYPKLAAYFHAIMQMVNIHQSEKIKDQRRSMAEYHKYFRKVINNEKLPLTGRINVACFLVDTEKAPRIPVELARDLAIVYGKCLEGNTPLVRDQNRKMIDMLFTLKDEPAATAELAAWRDQWAKRYLGPTITTSNRNPRRIANLIDNAQALSRAMRLYLAADDFERVKLIQNKYGAKLNNSLLPISILIRADHLDLAVRQFRLYQNGGEFFHWPHDNLAYHDEEIRAKTPAFLEKFDADDERFLAEVLLAAMRDPKPAKDTDKKLPSREQRMDLLAAKFKGIKFSKASTKLSAVYMITDSEKATVMLSEEVAEYYKKLDFTQAVESNNSIKMQQASRLITRHIRNCLRKGDLKPLLETLDKQPTESNNHHWLLEHHAHCIEVVLESMDGKDFQWKPDQYAALAASLRKATRVGFSRHTSYHNSNNPFSQSPSNKSYPLFMIAHIQGGQSKEFDQWFITLSADMKNHLRGMGIGKGTWIQAGKIIGKPTAENLQERLQLTQRAADFILHSALYRSPTGMVDDDSRGKSVADLLKFVQAGILSTEELITHGVPIAAKLDDKGLVKVALAQYIADKGNPEQSIAALQAALKAAPEKDVTQRAAWNFGLAVAYKKQGKAGLSGETLKKVDPEGFSPEQKKTYDQLKAELAKLTAKTVKK
ncbi:MAG: tetratricopeptide repeat protein [Pirellulales bacterium]|nr:tetratricopeptide repeat protein [Pirellulales bacterium]